MMLDRETIKRQLDQLLHDIGHVGNNSEMLRRFSAEDKAVMNRTADFINQITNDQSIPIEEAIYQIEGDDRYVEFMKVLFEFAQVIKSHQRQGPSQMKKAGKVTPGQRRITRPEKP